MAEIVSNFLQQEYENLKLNSKEIFKNFFCFS